VKIPEYSWCRSRAPCNQQRPDSIPRRRGQPGWLWPACSFAARPGEQSSWRAKALPRGVSRAFATGARRARPSSCTEIGGVGRVARGRWRLGFPSQSRFVPGLRRALKWRFSLAGGPRDHFCRLMIGPNRGSRCPTSLLQVLAAIRTCCSSISPNWLPK